MGLKSKGVNSLGMAVISALAIGLFFLYSIVGTNYLSLAFIPVTFLGVNDKFAKIFMTFIVIVVNYRYSERKEEETELNMFCECVKEKVKASEVVLVKSN